MALSSSSTDGSPLRLVALGGWGEIGMNCLALEDAGAILVIDCGITFPTTDLGIDVIHPRFDFLRERAERVCGVVLTHGHEDHIGGLPYLLRTLPSRTPVRGPAHALELARQRLFDHGFQAEQLDMTSLPVGARSPIGPFVIEPVRVTHSITDATALAIRTSAGVIVHTGDFKLDPSPPDGELTDEARLRELGREGVRLLLSDSTNVDSEGHAGSERDVGEALDELVSGATGRAVVAMFASNVQRLRMLGDIARRTSRRICLLGRSVGQHARAAQVVGRLDWPSDLVVAPEQVQSMPRKNVLLIAGGTQAERGSALSRLANGTHPTIRLDAGDTVILSSRIIPGNDRPVFDMMSDFLRMGVLLVTRITDRRVHASGHAHREEQLRMIQMLEPRSFVPVHGTLHHLMRHAELARNAGVADTLVAENGEMVEVDREGPLRRGERIVTGRVATFGGARLSDEVLRERAQLGRAGVLHVALAIDAKGLQGRPHLSSRGVLETTHGEVLASASKAIVRAVHDLAADERAVDALVMDEVRSAARRTIETLTGRRPVVTVAVLRV